MQSTSVRIVAATHRALKELAASLGTTADDVVDLDLGVPGGREAGFPHPAVVVTAQRVLDAEPSVVQVVPLTSAIRGFASEVELEADARNGLDRPSAVQCQHVRGVAVGRIERTRGNVDAAALRQIRDVLGLILDLGG